MTPRWCRTARAKESSEASGDAKAAVTATSADYLRKRRRDAAGLMGRHAGFHIISQSFVRQRLLFPLGAAISARGHLLSLLRRLHLAVGARGRRRGPRRLRGGSC